jgi:hypothetical protein
MFCGDIYSAVTFVTEAIRNEKILDRDQLSDCKVVSDIQSPWGNDIVLWSRIRGIGGNS